MCLKLSNLSKAFDNRVILDNFSYSFSKTGLYVITGESGSGKTTLLRIISGLDQEYGGTVENGGIENVSFMFQEYRLFPTLSAVKNASIGQKSPITDDATKLLKRLGFLDEDLKKKPHHLSGGMRQRVSFARAVLTDSPILLLDEPTKELDVDTASIMLEVIKEESQRRLVIAVTHDVALSEMGASRLIRI